MSDSSTSTPWLIQDVTPSPGSVGSVVSVIEELEVVLEDLYVPENVVSACSRAASSTAGRKPSAIISDTKTANSVDPAAPEIDGSAADMTTKPMSQSGISTRIELYPGRSPDLVYKSTMRALGPTGRRKTVKDGC
jgi:hypothetical protein